MRVRLLSSFLLFFSTAPAVVQVAAIDADASSASATATRRMGQPFLHPVTSSTLMVTRRTNNAVKDIYEEPRTTQRSSSFSARMGRLVANSKLRKSVEDIYEEPRTSSSSLSARMGRLVANSKLRKSSSWAICRRNRQDRFLSSLSPARPATAAAGAGSSGAAAIATALPRGGACKDSNPVLAFKIALSAALETIAMAELISWTIKNFDANPGRIAVVGGLPITTWICLVAVIFASSVFGSVIDDGMSTASSQVLDPNVTPGDAKWYVKLRKPSWNPPNWLFPIMWLLVSKPTQLMAVSTLLRTSLPTLGEKVAEAGSRGNAAPVATAAAAFLPSGILYTYCAHLSLGDAWNKVFFGLQCTGRGAAVITVFFATLLVSAYLFSDVDMNAGLLMLPTCGWVAVATALNWNIYLTNKKKK